MSPYNTLFKYTPRLFALMLAFVMVFALAVPAFADGESGSCGSGLSWNLSGGTLTITGSGRMNDYTEGNMAPWYELRDEILRVSLPSGITNIGDAAFYNCANLTVVSIPVSVVTIGDFAFSGCKSLQMATWGSGLSFIGEGAFEYCYQLASVNLGWGIIQIGSRAFYRCESITTVMVPESVNYLGNSAFGFCKNLVSASIKAPISVLPEFLFYGCEKLTSVTLSEHTSSVNDFTFGDCGNLKTVYSGGNEQTIENLQNGIGEIGMVTEGEASGPISSNITKENPDGTSVTQNTTVLEGESSTVSSNIESIQQDGTTTSNSADIIITVEGESGWEEANKLLDNALTDFKQNAVNNGGSTETANITVYVKNSDEVDLEFINSLAGENVIVTFVAEDGSTWQMKGTDIDPESESESYDFRYEVIPGDAELCEKLGVSSCYVLKFLSPAQINAELMIRIDPKLASQNATLLKEAKEPEKIQTTVVDNEGYVHFYLASVTEETEYYIAINLPGTEAEAIVPQSMNADNGALEYIEPIKYEITGRSSSWGMNLGQVMGILGAVMVGVMLLIGGIMYIWNKQRLKNGYVPNMDDDEE